MHLEADSVKTSTFQRRLGSQVMDALVAVKTATPLADLIRQWDKNNDGDISLIEFRACVRNNLHLKADNQEIDAFFNTMDGDGGGSLDLNELKVVFKKLSDTALRAGDETAAIRARADLLQAKVDTLSEVAEATETAEAAYAKVQYLLREKPVDEALGERLVAKNLKVQDVMRLWDKDGDGTISKEEFYVNVSAVGLTTFSKEQIDGLFDRYDDDGGGSLDLDELKPTLASLIDSAKKAGVVFRAAERSNVELRKAAKRVQKELAVVDIQERKEAKLQEEAARAEAEAIKVAEEEKKRLAREAKEAKAAALAAEKAEYEAKIAVRRLGHWGAITKKHKMEREEGEAAPQDSEPIW